MTCSPCFSTVLRFGVVALGLALAGPSAAQDKDQEYNPAPAPADIDVLQKPKGGVMTAVQLPWRIGLYDAPNKALLKAVEELETGDRKDAAHHLEEARGYLKSAIDRGRQEEPRDPWDRDAEGRLEASADELKKVVHGLQAGDLPTVESLRPVFGRYLLALARSHVEAGSELWLAQTHDLAGYEFQAAAQDIEHALAWNDLPKDEATAKLLAETERVGKELIEAKKDHEKEAMAVLVASLRETVRATAEALSAPRSPKPASSPEEKGGGSSGIEQG